MKGITSLASTSSSTSEMIVIGDSLFIYFNGICGFDLLNSLSICFFFISKSPLSSTAFKCSFYVSSFFVRRFAISFWYYSRTDLCCLSISTRSSNYSLMNPTLSSILGEVVAFVTGEEYVTTGKAFLLCVLTIIKIHELWILVS